MSNGLFDLQGMIQAQRLAQEKAAADKAAYDAVPYAQRLADAKAAAQAAHSAYDAWKPDPATTNLPSWMQPKEGQALSAPVLAMMQMNNPNRAAMQAADAATNKLIRSHLQDQLKAQAGQYKFDWKGNKNADFHTGAVADMLLGQGLTDLSQLGYSKDGNYLMNKETGQNLKWYKQDKHKDNPLKNKGQLGWSAKGTGRTNYMVKADANGNPVLFPQWKSNAPGGLGGFLLDVAPVLTSFIPGVGMLGAAAINAGLTAAQGGGLGDILKSGALSAAGSGLSNLVSNAATANLPMLGTAGITNAAADAIGNAASGAARSAITGQDILSGAATGAAGSLIGSGAQGIAGLLPKDLTGVGTIDRNIAPIAANTISNVVQGQDVGSALAGSALTAAGGEAARAIPSTGSSFLDSLLRGTARAGTSQLVGSLLNNTPSAPARNTATSSTSPITATVPGTTSATTAPITAAAPTVNNQGNLLNFMALAGLAGSGQPTQTTQSPVLATPTNMDLSWMTPTANKLYGNKVI